jgi:hypothetical protein
MQVIGFNLTKISGERLSEFQTAFNMNTNIEFLDLGKENIDILSDKEAINLSFKFGLTYESKEDEKKKDKTTLMGSIEIKGKLICSLDKEELKAVQKMWKKKELPALVKFPLLNVIIRKCTPKAIQLEDEIGLPLHTPIQQFAPKPTNE